MDITTREISGASISGSLFSFAAYKYRFPVKTKQNSVFEYI